MQLVNLEFLFYLYIFQSCHRDIMSLNMWEGSRRKKIHAGVKFCLFVFFLYFVNFYMEKLLV